MALPGNVSTLVVIGTFLTPEGTPSTGTITFTPSKWLTNSGANVALPNSSVTKSLGTAGDFQVTLPVTDDSDLQPANWFYTVSEVVDGVSQSYAILLPGTAATNGTVYLADIAPAAELGPEYASLRGPAGEAATVTVGTVTAGTAGGAPAVTNSGTTSEAVLDFVLVPGDTGPQGATGDTGPQGPAATIEVGNVTSVPDGGTAEVTNSGTSGSAVFDFVLVDGPTGPQGATGEAATVTVGTVGFVDYPGPGTVTNSGTSGSAVLDFILVRGPQGAIGDLTAADPISYVGSEFSLKYGAGLGTATGGTLVADFSDATPLALGTAAAGTAIELARGDHRHAMPSASDVGAVANSLIQDKSKIAVGNGSSVVALAAGADGTVLTANSGTSTGLEWAAVGGGKDDADNIIATQVFG